MCRGILIRFLGFWLVIGVVFDWLMYGGLIWCVSDGNVLINNFLYELWGKYQVKEATKTELYLNQFLWYKNDGYKINTFLIQL